MSWFVFFFFFFHRIESTTLFHIGSINDGGTDQPYVFGGVRRRPMTTTTTLGRSMNGTAAQQWRHFLLTQILHHVGWRVARGGKHDQLGQLTRWGGKNGSIGVEEWEEWMCERERERKAAWSLKADHSLYKTWIFFKITLSFHLYQIFFLYKRSFKLCLKSDIQVKYTTFFLIINKLLQINT